MNHHEHPMEQPPEIDSNILTRIRTPELRDVSHTLFSLAKKILESGKSYDLVLSDDASGRLVSLFVKGILDTAQESRGVAKPEIRFVASGRHNSQDTFLMIKEIIKKMSPGRTIIVTEHIETGNSVNRLARVLEELGLEFDIASLSVGKNRQDYITVSMPSDTELYVGETNSLNGVNLFDRADLTGVRKYPNLPFPKKTIDEHMTEEAKENHQRLVNQTRQDVHTLVEEALHRANIRTVSTKDLSTQ